MGYIVEDRDLVGAIKDFPIEVVQKMIERSEEQGNHDNINKFQIRASNRSGFKWSNTIEGRLFWEKVITEKNWEFFFKLYPKDKNVGSYYPRVMQVSDFPDFSKSSRRVVFMEKNGFYLAWINATTLEEAEEYIGTNKWKYARNVKTEVTLREISEKFGIPLSELRIKEINNNFLDDNNY